MHITKWLKINWLKTFSIALPSLMAPAAHASVLLQDTHLVAATPTLAQLAPEAKTFTVTSAGQYRVTLSDVGFPARLTSLSLVISQGIKSIARLTQAGSIDFDATPGEYIVRVIGSSATAGSMAVNVTPVDGGAALLQYSVGVVGSAASTPPNQSSFTTKLNIANAGTYTVTVTDQLFPTPLTSYDLIIVDASGAPLARVCNPAKASICSASPVPFDIAAGSYDLFSTANAASPLNAGLYSVSVDGPASTNVLAMTLPVGVLTSHATVDLPANDQYTLSLNDLQFPAALTQKQAVVTQGTKKLAESTGAPNSFVGASGPAVVYSMVSPPSSGAGTYALQIQRGVQNVYSDIQGVSDAANANTHAFAFMTTLPSAGNYKFRVKDFAFPSSLASTQTLITQGTVVIATLSGVGSVDAQANAGPTSITVVANSPSGGMGMFSVGIDTAPSSNSSTAASSTIYEATQGVGDLFHTRTISVASSGNLDIELNDLALPAAFADLALAVTRGNSIVGQVFGGGKFTFAAMPGDYSLNFVARSATAQSYGLYGVQVADSPPAPTVTLSAAKTTIAPQGTTDVTWTADNATSCVASGGWAGSRTISGAQSNVGPFASSTSLTLTCTGPGGSSSAVANITVAEPATEKGSGALDTLLIGALLLLTTSTNVRRR